MTKEEVDRQITLRLNEHTTQIVEIVKGAVTEAVKTTVNGKIDKVTQIINQHVSEETTWRSDIDPMLKIFKDATSFQRFGIGILKGIILGAAAIGSVLAIIKFVVFLSHYGN